MNMLTFSAQLSLDFIFAGMTSLPNQGEEVMADAFDIQLGGGTLAYPIVLARLGIPVRVLVKTSKSNHCRFAMELLEQYPIKEIIPIETRDYDPVMSTAVISTDADRSFISKNNDRALVFDEGLIENYYKESKVVFATKEQEHLIHQFKKNGSSIVFDIGWSEDLKLDDYKSLLSVVDYFTPNDKEALKMTGAKTVEESLHILAKYVRYPVVSCGKDGCKTIIKGKILHIPVPKQIEAIDMTGAGDNFMAGLIYGIYMDMDPINCIRFGNCTGALSTTGLGCYGRDYRLEEVLELMKFYEN